MVNLLSFSKYQNSTHFVKDLPLSFVGSDNFIFIFDCFNDIFLLSELWKLSDKISQLGSEQRFFSYRKFGKNYLRNWINMIKQVAEGFKRLSIFNFIDLACKINIINVIIFETVNIKIFKHLRVNFNRECFKLSRTKSYYF